MNPQAPGKTKVRVLVTHTTRTWYELEVDENLSDREIFQQATSLTPEQLAELPREDDPEGPRVRVRDFEHHIDPEQLLASLKRAALAVHIKTDFGTAAHAYMTGDGQYHGLALERRLRAAHPEIYTPTHSPIKTPSGGSQNK